MFIYHASEELFAMAAAVAAVQLHILFSKSCVSFLFSSRKSYIVVHHFHGDQVGAYSKIVLPPLISTETEHFQKVPPSEPFSATSSTVIVNRPRKWKESFVFT